MNKINTDPQMAKDYLPEQFDENIKQDQYIESLKKRFPELENKTRKDILYLLQTDQNQRNEASNHFTRNENFYNHINEMNEKSISIDDISFPEKFLDLKQDENLKKYINSFFNIQNQLNNNNLQAVFSSVLARINMNELFSVLESYLDEYREISNLKSFEALCKSNGHISVYVRYVGSLKKNDHDAYEKFIEIEKDTPFMEFCKNIESDDFDVAIESMLSLVYNKNYERFKEDKEFIQSCKTGNGYEIKKYI